MFCPYCKSSLREEDARCAACSFDLDGADRLFGQPPQLRPGVNDLSGSLHEEEIAAVHKQMAALNRDLPQVKLSVLVANLPPDLSLPTYATWTMNRSGLSRASEVGGLNHNILAVIDPGRAAASLQIGYGLEPFLGAAHLEAILERSSRAFGEGITPGLLALVEACRESLFAVWDELGQIYGLDMEAVCAEEARRLGTSG